MTLQFTLLRPGSKSPLMLDALVHAEVLAKKHNEREIGRFTGLQDLGQTLTNRIHYFQKHILKQDPALIPIILHIDDDKLYIKQGKGTYAVVEMIETTAEKVERWDKEHKQMIRELLKDIEL